MGLQSANATKTGFSKFINEQLAELKKAQTKKLVAKEIKKTQSTCKTPTLESNLTKDSNFIVRFHIDHYVHRLVGGKCFQRSAAPASAAPMKAPPKFEIKGEAKFKGSKLDNYKIINTIGMLFFSRFY